MKSFASILKVLPQKVVSALTMFAMLASSFAGLVAIPSVAFASTISGDSNMAHYSVWGNSKTYLGSNTSVLSGLVGSNGKVLGVAGLASSVVTDGIQSGDDVNFLGSLTTSGNILSNGSVGILYGANVTGGIDAGGTIGTGPGSTIGGTQTPNDGTPATPLPTLPAVAACTGNSDNHTISSNASLTPGTYGTVNIHSSKTLTLDGAGTYVLKSLSSSGSGSKLNVDVHGGTAYICIQGAMSFTGSNIQVTVTNGDASDVLFVVQGSNSGTLPAVKFGSHDQFTGTLYATQGDIEFGDSASVTGALYSTKNLSLTSNAVINFTPSTGFNDLVNPPAPNTAPVANDISVTTDENVATSGTLTGTDADSDTLTFATSTSPSHGTLSGFNAATGDFTYTPAADYSGPDSFTYVANDGTVDSNIATVSITVNEVVPPTGSIQITKYECPADTTVTRDDNGVGGTVPEGCTPQADKYFGYVHGDQTDANSPYPELSESFTLGGATDGSGVLNISDLLSAGRYLVAETDSSGNQLAADQVLGLYCAGDGDTSGANDNQELTFVPADGTVNCVAYDAAPAVPTAPDAPVLTGFTQNSNTLACGALTNNNGTSPHTTTITWTPPSGDLTQYAIVPTYPDGHGEYVYYPGGSSVSDWIGDNFTHHGDGTYSYTIKAQNTDGLWSDVSAPCTLIYDSTSPVVTVTPLSTDGSLSGTVTFTITVTDANLDPMTPNPVYVYLYNTSGSPSHGSNVTFTNGVGTFTVDTTTLTDGSYTLDVGKLSDAAGNPTKDAYHPSGIDSYFSGYTIDNTVPAAPTNLRFTDTAGTFACGDTTNTAVGNSIQLLWDESSDKATAYRTMITYPDQTTTTAYTNTQNLWLSHTAYTDFGFGSQNGIYTYAVQARDAANNWYDVSAPCTLAFDTHSPTAQFDVTPPMYVNGNFDVSGTANDNVALKNVFFDVRDPSAIGNQYKAGCVSGTASSTYLDASTTALTACTINTSNLTEDHTYTLRIHASDFAGYGGGQQQDLILDTTAPVITVKDGYAGDLGTHTFSNVSFKLYDNHLVDYYVINGHKHDLTDNQWSDANFPNFESQLTLGENTIVLYDVAGNSTSYTFTYQTVQPTLSITAPAADNDVVSGSYVFTAEYDNGVTSDFNWAVHEGASCTDTRVAGNLGGFHDGYTFDGTTFTSDAIDTTGWADGTYCVAVDPLEPSGTDLRDTRVFTVDNTPAPVPSVTTDAASDISASDATLNATNGAFDAQEESFWVSTSTFDTSTPNIPANVWSTPVLSPVASSTAFSDPLSIVTTNGIITGGVNSNMPAITPNTTYYYVAWVNVGGTWYPGATQSFTTSSNIVESSNTVVVHQSDLAISFLDALNNVSKWFFWDDNTNDVNNSLGSFVTGPATAPLGDGSAEISAPAGSRIALATLGLAGTPLSEVKGLSYSTYRSAGTSALDLALQFDINTDGTSTPSPYQGRLVYEPYFTNTVSDNTWQTWDPMSDAHADWWFSSAGSHVTTNCTQATPCTWSDVLTHFPDIGISGGTYFRTGQWLDSDFTGNVDNFVVTTLDGVNQVTTTYDFEPSTTPDDQDTPDDSGNGSGGGSGGLLGDINHDGHVDILDLALLIASYNHHGTDMGADLNHDGVVNLIDLAILLAHWTN